MKKSKDLARDFYLFVWGFMAELIHLAIKSSKYFHFTIKNNGKLSLPWNSVILVDLEACKNGAGLHIS